MGTVFRIIILWVVLCYPFYLSIHVALDYLLGTQGFYHEVTRSSLKLLSLQVIQGWYSSLFVPIFYAIWALITLQIGLRGTAHLLGMIVVIGIPVSILTLFWTVPLLVLFPFAVSFLLISFLQYFVIKGV